MSKKHILVYRFSAMGDVALVAPVIKSVLEQHQNVHITFVTRPFFTAFFDEHPRLNLIGVNLNDYKGFFGLFNLFKELKSSNKFDVIIDLHDVLRTNILNSFFKLSNKKVVKLRKDRAEKKELIKTKQLKQLKHATTRYLDVFEKAKLKTTLIKSPWLNPTANINTFLKKHDLLIKTNKWIGIAPFAKHSTKVWGIEKAEELIKELLKNNHLVFLFGGGKEELNQLAKIQAKFPSVIIPSQSISFKEELSIIKKMDIMVTMDSSNMHIASLIGIKVISIWGATNPKLGFYPLNNQDGIIIQSQKKLDCQPCSVFGNKPCVRGDYACMNLITVKEVYNKLFV